MDVCDLCMGPVVIILAGLGNISWSNTDRSSYVHVTMVTVTATVRPRSGYTPHMRGNTFGQSGQV